MDTENKSHQANIEESFLEIIKDFKESYSGIFIKGVKDPEAVEKSLIFRAPKYFNEIFREL